MEEWGRWASMYEETGGRFTRINDEWIVRLLRPREGRVLDVGCGTGRLIRQLTQEDREVVGIDTSPRMIVLARKEERPGIRFQILSVFDVVSQEPIDVIIVCYLLHHMDTANVLPLLKKALLPGGTLLLLDPLQGTGCQRMTYLFLTTRTFGVARTSRLLKERFTSRAWKEHSLNDRLSDFSAFRKPYAALLPEADIRRVNAWFGSVLWRKPR